MKYENYEQAVSLIKKIKEEEAILEQLDQPRLVITIRPENTYSQIITIGATSSFSDTHTSEGRDFLNRIRKDIEQTIASLKAELMEL